jgi:hypothetical protein
MHPSSAPKLSHALISSTKINVYGLIQTFPCTCWNNCIAFSSYPSFAYFVSFLFHVEKFNSIVPNSIAPIYFTTIGGFCCPPPPRPPKVKLVFLCLKSKYPSFAYNENPNQVNHPSRSAHPKHKFYQKNIHITILRFRI